MNTYRAATPDIRPLDGGVARSVARRERPPRQPFPDPEQERESDRRGPHDDSAPGSRNEPEHGDERHIDIRVRGVGRVPCLMLPTRQKLPSAIASLRVH